MKRVVTIVLVGILLLGSVASADIDLTGMTLDDLLVLRDQINSRIIELIGDSFPVQGRYVTGLDIKEGYYILTNNSGSGIYISLYANLDDARKEENKISITRIGDGESTTIHLANEEVIDISNGTALLSPAADPSWKP